MSRMSHSRSMSSASADAETGNQSISRPRATPIAAATTPMSTIWRTCTLLCRHERFSGEPMDGASYGFGATDGTSAVSQLSCRARGAVELYGAGEVPSFGAVVGGRGAEMAPERLGELGGLTVAHAVGDLADRHPARGQQLGGLDHPHP